MPGINKSAFNLRFIKGQNSAQGLAGFLQAYLGQMVAVVRKIGTATVASGQTTISVADTSIAAADVVMVSPKTKGTNAVVVVSVVISAGVGFVVTVDTDPGAGGQVYNYTVMRPVSG